MEPVKTSKLENLLLPNFPHSPLVRIHCDGSRLTQLSGYQHSPLASISRGHRDALVARVGPVDVLMDPVHCQALGRVERVDERHLLGCVAGFVDVSAGGQQRRERLSQCCGNDEKPH